MNHIAIIMTCHNRKSTTLTCLNNLYKLGKDVDVYCVDDASTDGTANAIKAQFPQVKLVLGDGHLFWCRGMRKAWVTASKTNDYDFYIWLNDDVVLYPNAFEEILECSNLFQDKAIISGLIQEESSKEPIYGGYGENRKLISANGECNRISRLNGNFVIVPKYVFDKIGFFDRKFHHDIGDVDYGYTAQEMGVDVVSTRCYIGSTNGNLKSDNLRIRKNGVGLFKRFKHLYSPLGAPPYIHFYFLNKHFGFIKGLMYYLYLHVINIMPDCMWRFLHKT